MHSVRIHLIIALLAISIVAAAKNGQEDAREIFKINKLNLIWTKAGHSMGSDKLKTLKDDLLKHEADELSLKKVKAHNQDKDGLIELAVRKKLLSIMKKYAIERFFDDVHPPQSSNDRAQDGEGSPQSPSEAATFRDSKLDKLWKKAEKAGFSQEQLMILHEEFEHQQSKIDGHYEALNKIDHNLERQTINENSLESDLENLGKKRVKSKPSETQSEKKARLEASMHQGLKDKHSEIKKGLDNLQRKISTGVLHESRPFEEELVNDLWAMALGSNFSESDLESLKEELEHYETRVKKLKHFQNQLDRHKIFAKESTSYAEEDDEMKHIKRRVKDLNKKVEKTQKSIESMIKKQRDEL